MTIHRRTDFRTYYERNRGKLCDFSKEREATRRRLFREEYQQQLPEILDMFKQMADNFRNGIVTPPTTTVKFGSHKLSETGGRPRHDARTK